MRVCMHVRLCALVLGKQCARERACAHARTRATERCMHTCMIVHALVAIRMHVRVCVLVRGIHVRAFMHTHTHAHARV